MPYGRNIVFLPRYNDHALYQRLAGEPNTEVAPAGKVYPVADRPAYVHPRRSMSHLPAHGMLRRTSQHVAPQKGCNTRSESEPASLYALWLTGPHYPPPPERMTSVKQSPPYEEREYVRCEVRRKRKALVGSKSGEIW